MSRIGAVVLVTTTIFCMVIAWQCGCTAVPIHAERDFHIKRIQNAIRLYIEDNGRFPPSCTRAPDGTPLHSWRALLLPYLGHQDVYALIDFSVAWDHSNNLAARQASVSAFSKNAEETVDDKSRTLCYLALAGGKTWWDKDTSRQDEFLLRKALCVVEVEPIDQHWMQPQDLKIDSDEDLTVVQRVFMKATDDHVRCIQGFKRPYVAAYPKTVSVKELKFMIFSDVDARP